MSTGQLKKGLEQSSKSYFDLLVYGQHIHEGDFVALERWSNTSSVKLSVTSSLLEDHVDSTKETINFINYELSSFLYQSDAENCKK